MLAHISELFVVYSYLSCLCA